MLPFVFTFPLLILTISLASSFRTFQFVGQQIHTHHQLVDHAYKLLSGIIRMPIKVQTLLLYLLHFSVLEEEFSRCSYSQNFLIRLLIFNCRVTFNRILFFLSWAFFVVLFPSQIIFFVFRIIFIFFSFIIPSLFINFLSTFTFLKISSAFWFFFFSFLYLRFLLSLFTLIFS